MLKDVDAAREAHLQLAVALVFVDLRRRQIHVGFLQHAQLGVVEDGATLCPELHFWQRRRAERPEGGATREYAGGRGHS